MIWAVIERVYMDGADAVYAVSSPVIFEYLAARELGRQLVVAVQSSEAGPTRRSSSCMPLRGCVSPNADNTRGGGSNGARDPGPRIAAIICPLMVSADHRSSALWALELVPAPVITALVRWMTADGADPTGAGALLLATALASRVTCGRAIESHERWWTRGEDDAATDADLGTGAAAAAAAAAVTGASQPVPVSVRASSISIGISVNGTIDHTHTVPGEGASLGATASGLGLGAGGTFDAEAAYARSREADVTARTVLQRHMLHTLAEEKTGQRLCHPVPEFRAMLLARARAAWLLKSSAIADKSRDSYVEGGFFFFSFFFL
jgi:hypothetical protein